MLRIRLFTRTLLLGPEHPGEGRVACTQPLIILLAAVVLVVHVMGVAGPSLDYMPVTWAVAQSRVWIDSAGLLPALLLAGAAVLAYGSLTRWSRLVRGGLVAVLAVGVLSFVSELT